jgi:hypothetical protein
MAKLTDSDSHPIQSQPNSVLRRPQEKEVVVVVLAPCLADELCVIRSNMLPITAGDGGG